MIFLKQKKLLFTLNNFNQNLDILKKLIKDKYDMRIFIPSAGKTTEIILKI